MKRPSFLLTLALATAVLTILLASIGYIYATIRRYGTASFAFGGAVLCLYYTSIYFRDWKAARTEQKKVESNAT
jgi:hypothetical protein